MNPDEDVIVHQLGIARNSQRRPAFSAICRRCGLVVEERDEPISIGKRGFYAVRNFGTENMEIWEVSDPPPAFMKVCAERLRAGRGEK